MSQDLDLDRYDETPTKLFSLTLTPLDHGLGTRAGVYRFRIGPSRLLMSEEGVDRRLLGEERTSIRTSGMSLHSQEPTSVEGVPGQPFCRREMPGMRITFRLIGINAPICKLCNVL